MLRMTASAEPPKYTKSKPPAADKRVRTDWDAVHRDYRTAQLSLAEIGIKYGIDRSQVSRKARQLGWKQDLRAAVKHATTTKLFEESVTKDVTTDRESVTTTVDIAAETNKNVILGHRADIARLRSLSMGMADELTAVSLSQEELKRFFEVFVRTECPTPDALMAATNAYNALTRLPSRILGAKALAEALSKLQTIERKAFALDEEDGGGDLPSANLSDAERASRLAALLGKARKKAADAAE